MTMEEATACDAWKKCTLEMVNLITNNSKPSLIKDYNYLLLENIDLKKQNKIAIAALDSAISEKDMGISKNGEAENGTDVLLKNVKFYEALEKRKLNEMAASDSKNCEAKNGTDELLKNVKFYEALEKRKPIAAPDSKISERDKCISKNGKIGNTTDELRKEVIFCETFENLVYEKRPIWKESKRDDALTNKKNVSSSKLPELRNFSKLETSKKISEEPVPSTSCSVNKIQKVPDFVCNNCSKLQASDYNLSSDLINLKQQLEQANECNRKLTIELNNKTEENDHLRDQIQSLDLAVKTLTEAINLQDEQLSEYGSLVASLRKSRSQIIEKMKEANTRNNYNVMIMANIEQEVEQLRRQLDAYNELLINQQNINLIDKASSTEQTDIVQHTNDELLKKKDNYITLLQDRLCEAIVDLKHKDSEIKNHTNLVKELINNYETEKKCLEDRIMNANISTVKMEENRIKQQETMKQLMKLIEFLQGKLEKINKK